MVYLKEFQNRDKEDIVLFYKKVSKQTNFLSFYEDEYLFNFNQKADLMLIAYTDEIDGIITIIVGTKRKNSHIGILGIVVDSEYCNQGIGKQLITESLKWCKNKNINKVQLTVRTDNIIAISLYKKFNFKIEGELINDTCIDGIYYNVYIMSLFI